jgi:NitT/TauT family transport system permease protein
MKDRLVSLLLGVVSLTVLLVGWHVAVVGLEVPTYLLPKPADVGTALWSGYVTQGTYWKHLGTTVFEMAVGYVIGCSVAFVVGALVAEWRLLERLVLPYVVALQSMPKVALAPLLIVWFGFGVASKVVLVALICFFPVFINCFYGFRSAHPDLLRLYLHLKLPSAAGPIFAGLQIAVVLALIGAVVGEFVSSKQGLGYLIQSSTLSFDVATMFAAILTLSLIGIVASTIVRLLHGKLVFWERRDSAVTTPLSEGA